MKTKLPLFLLAIAALVLPVHAQSTSGQLGAELKGIVSVVMPGSITVSTKNQGEMAYEITPQTEILKEDGTAATLADITAGATVRVGTGRDPNKASRIQILPAKENLPAKNDGP